MVAPRDLRQTHTYVVMPLSEAAYREIRRKMEEAGYDHALDDSEEFGTVINMHGIAVAQEALVNYPEDTAVVEVHEPKPVIQPGEDIFRKTKHPSHVTRVSMDASTFDEICINCGCTDIVPGGWGKLADPCVYEGAPGKWSDQRSVREEAYEKDRVAAQQAQKPEDGVS